MVRRIEVLDQNEFWQGLVFQGSEIKQLTEALEIAIAYYEEEGLSLKAQAARNLLQQIYSPSLAKKKVPV